MVGRGGREFGKKKRALEKGNIYNKFTLIMVVIDRKDFDCE